MDVLVVAFIVVHYSIKVTKAYYIHIHFIYTYTQFTTNRYVGHMRSDSKTKHKKSYHKLEQSQHIKNKILNIKDFKKNILNKIIPC